MNSEPQGAGDRVGVLVVNVGTPEAPRPRELRRYLRQFLSDPRVIDIHPVGRWLLLNLVILPFRPRRSAEAYAAIWTEAGSPLLVHSRAFRDALQAALGPRYAVVLGMGYGEPSLASALDALKASGIDRVVAFPQFPHYASATFGSVLDAVYREAAHRWNVPSLAVVPPFWADEGFVAAWAAVGRPHLDDFAPDRVLFSFHGLPERQVLKSDETGRHCLQSADCCAAVGPHNRSCYRAQCLATARALAAALGLPAERWSVTFQSRLGRTPWLRPYTDEVVRETARAGTRRLLVFTPAFTADCLETLEEIGLRAAETFRAAGGEELRLVPCLNAHPTWVEAAARLVRSAAWRTEPAGADSAVG
jgi:ferrochelatase